MTDELLVLAGGVLLIGAIAGYFFVGPRRSGRAAEGASGIPEITITVEGGYDPALVTVPAGKPVRLIFDRREDNPCSEEVVLSDFGIRKYLPPHQATVIALTPRTPGSYDFMCGMGMLHGKLVVTGDDGRSTGKQGEDR
jgi:plastocyanin domain-containing protein